MVLLDLAQIFARLRLDDRGPRHRNDQFTIARSSRIDLKDSPHFKSQIKTPLRDRTFRR
jgi:hypothetical protein